MQHKSMTGHQQYEKRGGQVDKSREDIYRQLEDMGISTKAFNYLPTAALKELVDALWKAKRTHSNSA